MVRNQWIASIRKERKRNKIGAEIRIVTAFAAMLVLCLLVPETLYVFVGAVAAVILCIVRAFTDLATQAKRLNKREQLLEKGSFLVASATVEEVVQERNGKYFGRIRESKFRIPFTLAKKIHQEPANPIPVLLVQLEGETEIFAIPI